MGKGVSLPILFSLSSAVVAASTGLSSRTLIVIMGAVRNAGTSGLLPVGRGITEANQPLLVALYFAIACGAAAILVRIRSSNKKAFPSAWLLLAASAFSLGPVLVLWVAELIMIRSLQSSRDGVVANASLIEGLLFMIFGGGPLLAVLLLLGSILRVPITGESKWRSVAALSFLVTVFVIAAIAFQLRNAWINDLYRQFE